MRLGVVYHTTATPTMKRYWQRLCRIMRSWTYAMEFVATIMYHHPLRTVHPCILASCKRPPNRHPVYQRVAQLALQPIIYVPTHHQPVVTRPKISAPHGMTTPPPGVSGLTSYAVNSRIGMYKFATCAGSAATAAAAAGVGVGVASSAAVGGRPGLYYSPPGTSYTIIERPHSPHYYYNSAGVATKGGSLPGRGSAYLSSPSNFMSGTLPTSTAARHALATGSVAANGKQKRPISPEQVLRMFGATQSSSVPTAVIIIVMVPEIALVAVVQPVVRHQQRIR
ncbi:hypothetical protein EVAR_72196_1 [Eumeta japonica]|uniref:Uncharacterized protein n=1 Tax=Eumeta variegata TaxID=151549 RepID=A0A4C1SJZ8_EUMVA|nr:hypothetical protein EVAR_72196_1 [Eumeta japonica]